METLYRDYSPKGVQFYYLYKALAHPELNGYIKPVTLEERLMHIKEAKRTLGTEIDWLCDTMSNDLKHATGNAPNSEYVIDPDGKIVVMRVWSRPNELRQDLAGLVGEVTPATKVADLNLKVAEPPKTAPTGIVPRVRMPSRMRALKIEPQLAKSKHPFYVKLRAEADRELMRNGKGKMYLGFYLDPIYGVHWNNLVAPVQYEFFPPDGLSINPAKGDGPKVKEEADADPREFLLDVNRGGSNEPVRLSFRYFACTDTMCMPVTQQYLVRWEADPDGGAPFRNRQRGAGGMPGASQMLARMMKSDADGDGRISKEEAPGQMRRRFDQMDADGDGYLTREEIEARLRRMRGNPQERSRGDIAARLMRSDADGDGKISKEEAPEQMRRRFDQMDADGDGYLTREEVEVSLSRRPSPGANR